MMARLDIVAIGEAMVEFNQAQINQAQMPGKSDHNKPRTYLQGFGGDTSNAVIAAARQGARCAYVTRLGEDDFGRWCLDLWRTEGVDAQAVTIDVDAATGIYFVHHDAAGHTFSYLRRGSAASRLQVADIPADLIRRAQYLHVSGISQAISTSATEAIAHAIEIARASGVRVSYDPNLRLALWPIERARAVIQATAACCDEFLPNLEELRLLSGLETPEDCIAWAHDQGAALVVLKQGAQGARVSDGRTGVDIAAYPVEALDATGAGDCFDGSYLTQRAAGEPPIAAARWACAAAALATTGYGAVAPLPTRSQVAKLLAATVEHN